MGSIFGKKRKEEVGRAPEELETPGEIKHIEGLSDSKKETKEELSYREIPVCLSQTQINNLVIENNIMLKQIISNMDE